MALLPPSRMRLLLVGALPPPLGGTTVLFQTLASDLQRLEHVQVQVVDCNSSRHRNRIVRAYRYLICFSDIVRHISNCDLVALNSSNSSLLVASRAVLGICRLFKKPLLIRKFGGPDHRRRPPNYDVIDPKYASKVRKVLQKADLYLAESQAAVAAAEADGIRARWLPNYRPMPAANAEDDKPSPGSCRRFVYVGHVKATKGIRELISAGEQLPAGCIVDVYGPLVGDISIADFAGLSRVSYRGTLSPHDVVATMRHYDALAFPTYHAGEGYAGVILEAWAAGLPVVTTRWRDLPELLSAGGGIMVEPADPGSLLEGLLSVVQNENLYRSLRAEAMRRRSEFHSANWTSVFVRYCEELVTMRCQPRTR